MWPTMLQQYSVRLTPLGLDRMIRVYLPRAHGQDGTRYPVLYMHDGQNLFRDQDASFGTCWGVAEYLEQSGREIIVVGIDCNHEHYHRFNEYAPWENRELGPKLFGVPDAFGGQARIYVDWIVRELKPFIDSRYRTLPDQIAMAGSSMGGLVSTYAACTYPTLFRRVASLSSAYWFNQQELEAYIRQSDLRHLERFYMDVGTEEVTGVVDRQTYIDSSQAVYALLREKVANLRFAVIEGGVHNESAWRARLPQVFGYLFD